MNAKRGSASDVKHREKPISQQWLADTGSTRQENTKTSQCN